MKEDPISIILHLHGATTHFPIAVSIVSIAFDLGSILFKNRNWRTVGFWTMIIVALASVAAIGTGLYYIYGDAAGKTAFASGLSVPSVLLHRNMGLIGGITFMVLALWRGLKKDNLNKAEFAIYLVLAIVATACLGFTGYKGAYVRMGY